MSDSLRDELVALTSDLIRFESIEERPDQLAAAADYLAAYLERIPGIFVHRSERAGRPSLVATLRETRTPALMLNGHFDVVVALPHQFEPQLRDGRIYGRASQDMKGSLAVMLRLVKDLAALEERPDVGFQFVGDEEIGGLDGTGRLLEEGWRCGFFIALEPTDLQICYAQKGVMWMELRLPGTPAHGSRPWDGNNPLLELATGITRLQAHFPSPTEPIWRTTVTPTIARAGAGSRNQVPGEARVTFDIRYTSEHTPAAIAETMQVCFPTAEVLVCKAGGMLETSPDIPALQRLAAVTGQVTAQETRLYREHFASDARFYSEAGIPAVCFGPIGSGLHSDEEWVSVESLAQLYAVLREFVK